MSLKWRETSEAKILPHKDRYSLPIKRVHNYRAVVGMISYLQWYTWSEILTKVHQCDFFNNPCLLQKYATRCITNYLASTSTHMDFPGGNRKLSTHGIFYRTYKERGINVYTDDGFLEVGINKIQTTKKTHVTFRIRNCLCGVPILMQD